MDPDTRRSRWRHRTLSRRRAARPGRGGTGAAYVDSTRPARLVLEDADLSFFATGWAPLLADHVRRLDTLLGVIGSAWLQGDELRAVVRFGHSPAARAAWRDVRVVFARRVDRKPQRDTPHDDDAGVLVVDRWTPHELSLVAVPRMATAHIRHVGLNHAERAALFADKAAAEATCAEAAREATLRSADWMACATSAAPALAATAGGDAAALAAALAAEVEGHLARLRDLPA